MKILWQNIFTKEISFTEKSQVLWDAMSQLIERVKSSNTEIDFAWLDRCSELNWYLYPKMMDDLEIINNIIFVFYYIPFV